MSQSIENALFNLHQSYGRVLLDDYSFLIQQLEAIYQPEWKADCRILSKAAQAGMGRIMSEYENLGRTPTAEERDRLALQLMTAEPNLYERDASRAVALYLAMLGLDSAPRQQPGFKQTQTPDYSDTNSTSNANPDQNQVPNSNNGTVNTNPGTVNTNPGTTNTNPGTTNTNPVKANGKKAKPSVLDIIGIILIVAGIIGIVYGFIFKSQTGMSLDMLFNVIDIEGLIGGPNFSTMERLLIFLMRTRFYTLFSGLGLVFIPRLLRNNGKTTHT